MDNTLKGTSIASAKPITPVSSKLAKQDSLERAAVVAYPLEIGSEKELMNILEN